MPHTHFLVAWLFGLIGVKLHYLSYAEALLIGVISTLIDIDHLFSYHKRHKKWSLKETWNAAVVKHEHERSFIQHREGCIMVSIILIAIFIISRKLAILLGIAYYIHYVLDHVDLDNEKSHAIRQWCGIPYRYCRFEMFVAMITIILIIGLFFF